MLIKKHSATDLIRFYPLRYWGWNISVKSSQCHNCWWPESSLPGVIIGNVLKLCNKRILSFTGDDFQLPASSQCRQPCWCHQMETFFRVTGPLCGKFTGHRWIPCTKASDAEFWCLFDLRLNKPLSKQSWCWWFETPSRPLWRQCNVSVALHKLAFDCYTAIPQTTNTTSLSNH